MGVVGAGQGAQVGLQHVVGVELLEAAQQAFVARAHRLDLLLGLGLAQALLEELELHPQTPELGRLLAAGGPRQLVAVHDQALVGGEGHGRPGQLLHQGLALPGPL